MIFFIDFVLQLSMPALGMMSPRLFLGVNSPEATVGAVGEQLVFVALAGEDAGLGIDAMDRQPRFVAAGGPSGLSGRAAGRRRSAPETLAAFHALSPLMRYSSATLPASAN